MNFGGMRVLSIISIKIYKQNLYIEELIHLPPQNHFVEAFFLVKRCLQNQVLITKILI